LIDPGTLTQFDYAGGRLLYHDQPYSTTVKANGTLKCLKMNVPEFKRLVQPILVGLEQSAREFNQFINVVA